MTAQERGNPVTALHGVEAIATDLQAFARDMVALRRPLRLRGVGRHTKARAVSG